MRARRGSLLLASAVTVAFAAIFAVDLHVRPGVGIGALYGVGVMALAAVGPRSAPVLVAAGAAVVLVGIDFAFVLVQGSDWAHHGNSAIALATILGAAGLGVRRAEAERQRRSSEQAMSGVLAALPDAMLTLDRHGTVTALNAEGERMFGYAASEVVGRNVAALMEPSLQDTGSTTARPDGGAPIDVTRSMQGRRKDGSRFALTMSMGQRQLSRGALVFTGFVRDVSELQQSQRALLERNRQLENANRELDGFTYSVSHDLRAPLRAITGFARILLEEHREQLDAEGQRLLGIVCKNVDKMGELVDDLLAFSRLGRQALEPERLDMNALARETFDELRLAHPGRDVRFELGALPAAHGDPKFIRQVWTNLLDNALKYTRGRAPAVIEVSGWSEGIEDVYRVRDNGVGFEMQYVDKLFQVFQRLHKASEFEGTGVGLALVQRIVARHGGRVWAEAVPDEGASFYFALPHGET